MAAYSPQHDETKAKGPLYGYIGSFAKLEKNGVEFLYIANYEGGVYKSSDNGKTWMPANGGYGNGLHQERGIYIESILAIGNDLYASVDGYWSSGSWEYGGVYKSSDGGTTWAVVKESNMDDNLYSANHLAVAGNYLYVGCSDEGVYRLNITDENATWETVIGSGTDADYEIRYMTITSLYASGNTLFAGGYGPGCDWSGGMGGGVYKIDITGGTINGSWKKIGKDDNSTWGNRDTITNQGVNTMLVIGDYLYAGVYGYWQYGICDGGIHRIKLTDINSADALWEKVHGPLDGITVWDLYWSSSDNFLYAATESGLFKASIDSSVGGTVAFGGVDTGLTDNILDLDVYSFFHSGNTLYVGMGGEGVFWTNNGGSSWEAATNNVLGRCSSGQGATVGALKYNPNDGYLYAGFYGDTGEIRGGVVKSNDGGANWIRVTKGLNSTSDVNSFYFFEDRQVPMIRTICQI